MTDTSVEEWKEKRWHLSTWNIPGLYVHLYTLLGEKKGYYSEVVLSFCAFSMYLSPGYSELLKNMKRNALKHFLWRQQGMLWFIALFSKHVCRTLWLIIIFSSTGQPVCMGGPRCSTKPGFYFSSSFPFIFPPLSFSSYSFLCNCTRYHLSSPSLSRCPTLLLISRPDL